MKQKQQGTNEKRNSNDNNDQTSANQTDSHETIRLGAYVGRVEQHHRTPGPLLQERQTKNKPKSNKKNEEKTNKMQKQQKKRKIKNRNKNKTKIEKIYIKKSNHDQQVPTKPKANRPTMSRRLTHLEA